MTPRQDKLVTASMAVDSAIKDIERKYPASRLDDPIMSPMMREIIVAARLDIPALDLASKTVMAVAADPENFGACMKLRAEKPKEFEAIMVLVRIELERKPEEQQVAA